jgi:hypothetical protein
LSRLLAFDDFQRDFKAGIVPQFVSMSPNMMNDGHNTTLKYATDWSHQFLKGLLADKAFKERTLVLLTYDEVETYGQPNRIVSLLLGSAIPPALKGTTDDTYYTHYSILSTVENNWELPNLGRYDVGANVFKFVADESGYTKNKKPANADAVNNSISYAGALNQDPTKYMSVPPPNFRLIGAGGLPLLEDVRLLWLTQMNEKTPYDGSGNFVDGYNNRPVYKDQAPNQI